MHVNISTRIFAHLDKLLQAATYSLETYPFPTFLVLVSIQLLSIGGLGWLLYRWLGPGTLPLFTVERYETPIRSSRADSKAVTD